MAKKESFELDDFDFESELDFNFDDSSQKTKIKDDRLPVKSVLKGVAEGAKSAVVSPSFIRKLVRKALPRGYGDALALTEKSARTLKGLYDSTQREIKPMADDLKRTVARALPSVEEKLPREISEKLKKWSSQSRGGGNLSEEEMRDASIQIQLADIFKAQTALDVKDRARKEVKENIQAGIDFGRHKDLIAQLDAMRVGVQRLAGYQENIGSLYQRKSLELQYRQYFIAADTLKHQKEFGDLYKLQLEAIAKNTALPEYVKITQAENFQQLARNRFLQKSLDTIFNRHDSFFDRVSTNIKNSIKDKVDRFNDSFISGLGNAEQMLDAQEMMRSFKEMGMEVPNSFQIGGSIISAEAVDGLGSKLGAKLGKRLKQNDKILAKGNQLSYIYKYYPQLLERWAAGPSTRGMGSGVKNWFKDMILENNRPDYNLETDRVSDVYKPAVFNNRTAKSITEIIPGYLARIFREIQILRTGDTSVGLTHYDFDRNDFSSAKDITSSLRSKVYSQSAGEDFRSRMDDLLNTIDQTGQLSKEERAHLAEYLMKSDFHDKASLTDSYSYSGKASKHSEKYVSVFSTFFGEDPLNTQALTFADKFSYIGRAVPDVRELLQTYANLGYLPLLKEIGIVDENGSVDVNKMIQYYLTNDEPIDELKTRAAFRLNQKRGKPSAVKQERSVSSTTYNTVSQNNTHYTQDNSDVVNAIQENSAKPTAIEILEVLRTVSARLEKGIPTYGFSFPIPEGENPTNWLNMSVGEIFKRAGKKLTGAFNTARTYATAGFENAKDKLTTGFGLFKDRGMVYMDKAKNKLNEFRDVYVKGELSPRMILSKLKDGHYAILNPDGSIGKIIKSFKDVTGDIVDATTGEIVLRADEIKNAFVKNRLGGVVLEKLGAVAEKAKNVGKYLNLQFTNAYTLGFSLVKSGYRKLMLKLDEPQDVYVVGKPFPVLLAVTMRAGGYFSKVSNKPIYSPKDIDGPISNSDGEILLTQEDIAKGLLNKEGKPLRTGLSRVTGYLSDKAKSIFNLGKNALDATKEKVKSGVRATKDFLQGKLGFDIGLINNKTNAILLQIRNMLNDRLSGDRTSFNDDFLSGSKSDSLTGAKEFLSGFSGKMSSRFSSLKNKLTGSNLFTGVQGFMSNIFGRLRGFGTRTKSFFTKLPPSEVVAAAGIAGLGEVLSDIRDRLPKKPGMFSGLFGGKDDGGFSITDMLLGRGGAAAGASAGATLGGSAAGAAGATAAGAAAGKLGLLAKLKNAGSLFGKVALGSLSAGKALAGAGSLASGALSVGGGLLAGLGSIIASPVVLGTLAVAGVAAGAYYGYKYFSKKSIEGLSKLRYAQYGFIPTDKDHIEAVFGLEDKLLPGVVYDNGIAKIDDGKLKVKDVISGFGVDINNQEQVTNWLIWFSKRFKPVFLTHLTALNSVDPKASLSSADSLDKAKLQKYFEIAKWPNGPYNVMQTPFPDQSILAAGDKEVSTITSQVAETVGKSDNQKTSTVSLLAPTSAAVSSQIPVTKPESNVEVKTNLPSVSLAETKTAVVLSTGGVGFAGTLPLYRDAFASGKVSALDSIRFKTYGLKEMELSKLRALSALEDYIDKEVVYSRKGVATWNGQIDNVLAVFGGRFGVMGLTGTSPNKWLSWFAGRFMPVFLNYLTAANSIAGKKNLQGTSDLTTSQELDVSMAITSTTTNANGVNITVWKALDSPWSDYELNSDPTSITDNLQGLEEKLKSSKLTSVVGKSSSLSSESKSALGNNLKAAINADTEKKPSSVWESAKQSMSNIMKNVTEAASSGIGFVKEKASEMYQGAKEILGMGPGTGGKVDSIPMPKGEGSWNALKDTIIAASKMVGVDEKLMATMAAIESGFRYTVKAGTSSATGLYQFIKGTWDIMVKKYGAKYGITPNTPPTDPRANAILGAEYIRENTDALKRVVKRKLTDTDLYIAHFLGAGGAQKFLTADPNVIAANLLPAAAKANTSIFYSSSGTPLTVAEVYNVINGRVRNKGKQFGLDAGGSDVVASPSQTQQSAALSGSSAVSAGSASAGVQSSPTGSKLASNTPTSSGPGSSYTSNVTSVVPSAPAQNVTPTTNAAQAKTREDASIYTTLQKSTDTLVEINKDQLSVLKAILTAIQKAPSKMDVPKTAGTTMPNAPTGTPTPIVSMAKPSYG